MIQSLHLELFWGGAPTPIDALDFAECLLKRVILDGAPIRPQELGCPPRRGEPWSLGPTLSLSHPALPRAPHDATLAYIPAGRSSPGGFALCAPVFEGSGTDAEALADFFERIGRRWVELDPPDHFVIFGDPEGPRTAAFRGDSMPSELGWVSWLKETRWPISSRLRGLSLPGLCVEVFGEGVLLRVAPRLGDLVEPGVAHALSEAVGQSVSPRTGGRGARSSRQPLR